MCSAQPHVCFGPIANTVPTLLDNLIGALLERQGHVKAEHLRSLEVDHKLELGWLQYWQVGRPLTLEDTANVYAYLTIGISKIRRVAHQAASHYGFTRFISRRNVVTGGLRYDLIAQGDEKRIRTNDNWSGLHLGYLGECGIKLMLARSAIDMKLQSESACCLPDILDLSF